MKEQLQKSLRHTLRRTLAMVLALVLALSMAVAAPTAAFADQVIQRYERVAQPTVSYTVQPNELIEAGMFNGM